MTYTVSSPDRSGMVCRVTSTDAAHQFRLITDYLTDPARASVVIHTTLEPLGATPTAALSRLEVYVRYDATIDNTGGGGKTNALANNAVIDRGALVSSDTTMPTGPFAPRWSARWPPTAPSCARRVALWARPAMA